MALYLAEGDGSNGLLGLSCRRVLIGPNEANVDYVRHPSGPPKYVVLLSKRDLTKVVDSIELTIAAYGISSNRWKKQVEGFEEREKGTDAADVEKARADRIETQGSLDKAEKAMNAPKALLDQVNRDSKKLDKRVLGPIIRSPAISLGVGEQLGDFSGRSGQARRRLQGQQDESWCVLIIRQRPSTNPNVIYI